MNHTLLLVSGKQTLFTDLHKVCLQAGYKTYNAFHANDALQIMTTRSINAVICDATLSDIDGYHLCYKIRGNEKLKNTPVIICATEHNTTDAQMARDMGADIFISSVAGPTAIVDHVTDIFTHPRKYEGRYTPPVQPTESMLRYNEQLIARLEEQNNQLLKAKYDLEGTVRVLSEAQQIAHIGSWEMDIETLTLKWSDELFRIFGTTPEETNPGLESFLSFIHPDDLGRVKATVEISLTNFLPVDFTARIVHKNGQVRQIFTAAKFDQNNGGIATRAFGITHDITERLEVEQKVRDMNAELEARVAHRTEALVDANMQLESFAYSVSHDLRAPLRSILSFAQLLERKNGPQLDKSGTELLEFICSNSLKMQTLIDELLAFSRLGKNKIEATEIGLTGLVCNTWDSLTANLEPKPEFRISALPTVKADNSMITQVLINLLSNAIKYSAHSSHPVVEIGTLGNSPQPTIFVKDNGAGFDMAHYDKLFAVFQRLHTSTEFEGTGVGLAIVKRIIDKHNGKVWAESTPGQGATFYFSLPA